MGMVKSNAGNGKDRENAKVRMEVREMAGTMEGQVRVAAKEEARVETEFPL